LAHGGSETRALTASATIRPSASAGGDPLRRDGLGDREHGVERRLDAE